MNSGSRSIELQDGRALAYAEYGDLHGRPVFFFHGTPGSRYFRPPDEVTRQLGVRLIAADRPGYGLSTFQAGRRCIDWPRDIVQLADALDIEKFAVAGHSGGGPYVLACAFALPERVSAAASLSGAGPLDSPGATEGMTPLNKAGFKVGRFIPWPLWRLLIRLIYRRRSLDPAAAMDDEIGHRPAADDVQIARPEVRAACLESEREAFRYGLGALAWDARLLTRPWGFRPEEIRVPVHLWHGTADNLTTAAMAQALAARIPGSRVTICQGEAHLLLFPHWHEILTQLISE